MNPLTSLQKIGQQFKTLALLAQKVNFEKKSLFGNAIENMQRAPNMNPLTSLQKIGHRSNILAVLAPKANLEKIAFWKCN